MHPFSKPGNRKKTKGKVNARKKDKESKNFRTDTRGLCGFLKTFIM